MTQQNHVVWTQARGGAISPATRQQFAYNATSAADDGSKTCPSGASSPSQSLLSLSPHSLVHQAASQRRNPTDKRWLEMNPFGSRRQRATASRPAPVNDRSF